MDRLAALGVGDVSAIAQQAELLNGHARDLAEHVRWDDLVELGERRVLVAVGHEEGRNCAGEAAQVVADAAFDGLLLALLLSGLNLAHHGLAGASHQLITRTFEALHEALPRALDLLVVSTVDLVGLLLRLREVELACAVLLDAVPLDGEVAHLAVEPDVHIRLDAALNPLLLGGAELVAVVLVRRLHERLGDAVREHRLQVVEEHVVGVAVLADSDRVDGVCELICDGAVDLIAEHPLGKPYHLFLRDGNLAVLVEAELIGGALLHAKLLVRRFERLKFLQYLEHLGARKMPAMFWKRKSLMKPRRTTSRERILRGMENTRSASSSAISPSSSSPMTGKKLRSVLTRCLRSSAVPPPEAVSV